MLNEKEKAVVAVALERRQQRVNREAYNVQEAGGDFWLTAGKRIAAGRAAAGVATRTERILHAFQEDEPLDLADLEYIIHVLCEEQSSDQ